MYISMSLFMNVGRCILKSTCAIHVRNFNRTVVAIAMLTTQLCSFQDITVSDNVTIVRWLYANMSVCFRQTTVETASTCTDTILLRQHTQNFDYKTTYLLTYLQNKCYTGETEHMYVDSTSIKCTLIKLFTYMHTRTHTCIALTYA